MQPRREAIEDFVWAVCWAANFSSITETDEISP